LKSGLVHPTLLRPGITLYLIRHGETDWNRDARYQGQRDVPLNATGRAQARRQGEVLKPLMPALGAFDFVSSPLGRAVETMQLIRAALELDPENFRTDAQIVELSYGHWEGQLAAELPDTDPTGVAQKTSDPFSWRPANGESYRDLQQRVSTWLATLEKDTVAVTHGGVSRVARGAILGIEDALVPFLDVPQDKILKLRDATMSWL
jgi:broad specificity phosphatase PhoE